MNLPLQVRGRRFDLEAVRAGVSIVEICEARGVAWDKRKSRPGLGDYWACCPFHTEKSASFHVTERPREGFNCFGCGAKGDVFALVMRFEGVGFADALEACADRAGLSGGDPEGLYQAREAQRERLAARERAAQERESQRLTAVRCFAGQCVLLDDSCAERNWLRNRLHPCGSEACGSRIPP